MKANTSFVRSPAGVALTLALLTIALLAPFANKAFHIDDPIFLWPAREILNGNPRPLAAKVNWGAGLLPLAQVTNHFPFVSAMMTPVLAVAGFSESALHAQFAIFAALAVAGMFCLARAMLESETAITQPSSNRPLLAALILLTSPAFFVSATTVMSDVPMLCFWIWSMVVWFAARRSDKPWLFLVSGALMTFAALSKYPGLQIVPLLAVAATSRRRLVWHIVALLMPVVSLVIVQILTRRAYGAAILSVAVQFAAERPEPLSRGIINGLSFMGGCFPAPAIIWCLGWSRRQTVAGVIAALCLVPVMLLFTDRLFPLLAAPGLGVARAHAILFCLLGCALLWMGGAEFYRRRDRTTLLLALWVFGVFVFASVINWTTNARSVLPMGPALAMLAIGSLPLATTPHTAWRAKIPIGLGAILSLILATADLQIANASRTAAQFIYDRAVSHQGTVWFTGHWGFQWYMEKQGAVSIDYDSSIHQGDLLVEHYQNYGVIPVPPDAITPVDEFEVADLNWVSTINLLSFAHFYSSVCGPLPYVFAQMDSQRFAVYRVTRDFSPKERTGKTAAGTQ